MKFEKGDLVWITWCPDEYVGHIDRRCYQGEIVGYWGQKSYSQFGLDNTWEVDVGGTVGLAAEPALLKVPPEEHGRREEKEEQKPVEAVSSDC